MTLLKATKEVERPATARGTLIKRGKTRGTLTIAISFSRPNASRPESLTIKFNDLLATNGKGCAGSSPTGTSKGFTSRSK